MTEAPASVLTRRDGPGATGFGGQFMRNGTPDTGEKSSGNGAGIDVPASPDREALLAADRVLGAHSTGGKGAEEEEYPPPGARPAEPGGWYAPRGNAERESRGADMIDQFADRVDDFARERLDQGGFSSRAADYLYGFTDLLDSLSRSVRSGDGELFRRELTTQVRRSPLKAVAISMGVGFLLGKLIK
jgi:ElaB/YqjD/DUF883 family membrane-anchored ribosome-binding protein